MYNVPTYAKFRLHRVPRTDHRRKSRTPCIHKLDNLKWSCHVSHTYNVASMCAFQVLHSFSSKNISDMNLDQSLHHLCQTQTRVQHCCLESFFAQRLILLNLFKRNLRVIFVFNVKLVLIHIVIVYLSLILICWNNADWNLTLFSCSKYVITFVI